MPVTEKPRRSSCTGRFPIQVGGFEVLQEIKPLRFPLPRRTSTGSITKMETDVVDDSGAQVPISRLMLHHIVFINAGKLDKTCQTFLMTGT